MARRPDEAAEAVGRAVALARRRVPGGRMVAVERFLSAYYAGAAPDDVTGRDPADLYGAAMAHWQAGHHRRPGEALARVYNPAVDEHGWQSTHTAVDVVTDDMPFLVDSVTMELNRQGFGLHLLVHPVLAVRRDAEGVMVDVDGGPGAAAESFIHVEVDRHDDPAALEALRGGLLRVLGDVRVAVEDWKAMQAHALEIVARCRAQPPPVDPSELAEALAFLEWLAADRFTFLGFRRYDLVREGDGEMLRAVPGTGLGILRAAAPGAAAPGASPSFAALSPEAQARARERHLLVLTKANSRATVHRPTYLDYVGVRRFDDAGDVVGEDRFLGLYTSALYNTSPFAIPLLRRRVQAVVAASGFPLDSHDGKNLVAILETHPRDELLQVGDDELAETALGILHLQERQRVRLFVRRDAFGRFYSCLAFVPRDRYSTAVRERMQDILLAAFGGTGVEYDLRVSESVLARVHFVVHVPTGARPELDTRTLEARLAEVTRTWADDLRDALVEQCGEERGISLHRRWGAAFPAAYREDVPARVAVADIRRIEGLDGPGPAASLHRPVEAPPGTFRFKLYWRGPPVSLSGVLPLLENLGVTVVDERPYEVRPAGGEPVWVYDFGLRHPDPGALEDEGTRAAFTEAFRRVWSGEAESDGFGRLVLAARLGWREVAVLRACARYLRQAGMTYSQAYVEEALAGEPRLAALLVELFRARFDPARQPASDEAARLTALIESGLDAVESLDVDRILRSFLHLVTAMLRTNHFQGGPGGRPKPYLSFKVDPARVPDLPRPRPMFEIFVHSPRVEGVHLRGGPVARGGLRWSDRREDFRTEILGLMKAQMVKNTVIVPVGAKGGFVVRQPPAERDALAEEVAACYRTFVSGLLDLTDNLVAGKVVPPPDVVRYDGEDTYLVVAADKGTATFSDLANEVSAAYGYWLGDAFASGGSTGYDHKRMGITARGAWESVRRHFRELGVDADRDGITVVGVGDMSGDVFGNGMLLSGHLRLVAAFDHRHVFVDPDPDPEAGFAERSRLAALPRSSWADYDPTLISPGGGVFPRSAKSVTLSPEARRALGTDAARLTPAELIRAVLQAPVDLLWNGGIGTYVKARDEPHAAAGDKANDAVRVDAADLRCRVVAEGGNLGLTQPARVEYALGGGRVFCDFIDNSAGVDCSDHEVNLKILLDAAVADGDLTTKQRNALLVQMTNDVAALVLRDNQLQTQALGNARAQAAPMVDVHARYLRALEGAGVLDRALEHLPAEEDLGLRAATGGGLTAPELAVLLAYTKIALAGSLVASDLPDDPYLAVELEHYFPAAVRERFAERVATHPLRREIVATAVTNAVVNRAGTTFVFRLGEETGAAAADIARAHVAARDVFAMEALWAEIEALGPSVPASTQTAMLLETRKLVERAARWLLRARRPPIDLAATVAFFATGAAGVASRLQDLLAPADREALEAGAAHLAAAGVPAGLALRVAGTGPLFAVLDVVEVAAVAGEDVEAVARLHFALDDWLSLGWLRDRIVALPREDRWAALARAALRDDLYAVHRALTADVLAAAPAEAGAQPAEARLAAWSRRNRVAVERCRQVFAEIRAAGAYDLATMSVALREARNLIRPAG